jgi:hypothetical protein
MKLAFYKVAPMADDVDNLVPIKYAYMDGYVFGDRILEDVMFKYWIDDKGKLKSDFAKPNGYTKGLNKKKWLKESIGYVTAVEGVVEFQLIEDVLSEAVLWDHDRSWNDQPYTFFDEEPRFVTK